MSKQKQVQLEFFKVEGASDEHFRAEIDAIIEAIMEQLAANDTAGENSTIDWWALSTKAIK